MLTNLAERTVLTENVNRALRLMRFTIQTGLKKRQLFSTTMENREPYCVIVKDGKRTCRVGQKYLIQHQTRRKF